MCGDYILAVAAKVLAQIRNEDVLIVLAQVLADLVRGKKTFMEAACWLCNVGICA